MSEKILKLEDGPSYVGNNIEMYWREDRLYITCETPWSGCTESGFGHSCSVSVDKEQAAQIIEFIKGGLA